jgi:hypothetical protein
LSKLAEPAEAPPITTIRHGADQLLARLAHQQHDRGRLPPPLPRPDDPHPPHRALQPALEPLQQAARRLGWRIRIEDEGDHTYTPLDARKRPALDMRNVPPSSVAATIEAAGLPWYALQPEWMRLVSHRGRGSPNKYER